MEPLTARGVGEYGGSVAVGGRRCFGFVGAEGAGTNFSCPNPLCSRLLGKVRSSDPPHTPCAGRNELGRHQVRTRHLRTPLTPRLVPRRTALWVGRGILG